MTPALTILGSVLGALVGAWAGAQLALQRFKKERAFDARADWYGRAVRALLDLATSVGLFERAVRAGADLEEFVKQAARVQATQDAVAGHVRESILYGDPTSVASIRRAAEGMSAVARSGPEILGDAQIAANIGATRKLFLDAAQNVAAEGRKHLGLEGLPAVASKVSL